MQTLLDIAVEHSLIPQECLKRLYLLAKIAGEHAEGDLVECGVYKGGSAIVIGQALKQKGQNLWLFDSFTGMPESTEPDGDYAASIIGEGAVAVADVITLLDSVGISSSQLVIKKGLFQNTFKNTLPTKVSFLHIDACWYESVLACLRTFYHRIDPGGIIVLDDFGFWEGCREAFYTFIKEEGVKPLLERCGPTQTYWVKDRQNNRDGYY